MILFLPTMFVLEQYLHIHVAFVKEWYYYWLVL